MSGIASRLSELLEFRLGDIPMLEQEASDPAKDTDGSSSGLLAGSLRFVGVVEYALNGDVASFKANLARAAAIQLQLFNRYDSGSSVSESFVTMLAYKDLLNGLAAGDFDLTRDLARRMGGRGPLEREHDHPFDYTLGYALKAVVLKDDGRMPECIAAFRGVCSKRGNANFLPYADMLSAIASGDADGANRALEEIAIAHSEESKGRGIFANSEDEVLCVWGVALANLARDRGLHVSPVLPLIPEDLLIGCNSEVK